MASPIVLPLGIIFRKNRIHFHCYVDDIQLYLSSTSLSLKLKLGFWTTFYKFLLNGTKWTLHFLSKHQPPLSIILVKTTQIPPLTPDGPELIFWTPSTQHITTILKQLHWLPVHLRIDLNILIVHSKPSSALYTPPVRLTTMGHRGFSCSALTSGTHSHKTSVQQHLYTPSNQVSKLTCSDEPTTHDPPNLLILYFNHVFWCKVTFERCL